MKTLVSRDNPLVKTLRRLAAGGRRETSVLLDGVHLCQSWLALHGQPDRAIFDAARLSHPELYPDLAALVRQVEPGRAVSLDAALMKEFAAVESGQGVVFVVTSPTSELPENIDENCVLLDRIQDPGNVGTLLRASAAAGVKRVLMAVGSAAAWSPKVLRSGQGAHFALHIHEHIDPVALLARVRVPVVATALDGAIDLYKAELPARCMWVFGHEGQGVAQELLDRATLKVVITHEPAVESLNVAMAATLCLFEQRRRFSQAQSTFIPTS
jgi:TrmH family RNA methyltransferase